MTNSASTSAYVSSLGKRDPISGGPANKQSLIDMVGIENLAFKDFRFDRSNGSSRTSTPYEMALDLRTDMLYTMLSCINDRPIEHAHSLYKCFWIVESKNSLNGFPAFEFYGLRDKDKPITDRNERVMRKATTQLFVRKLQYLELNSFKIVRNPRSLNDTLLYFEDKGDFAMFKFHIGQNLWDDYRHPA